MDEEGEKKMVNLKKDMVYGKKYVWKKKEDKK